MLDGTMADDLRWDQYRLAMYYNGYIIICIFIGAYLGSFVFHWETLNPRLVLPSIRR